MRDEDSVLFRLTPPKGERRESTLSWFVGELENQLSVKGFAPIRRKVSGLGYGVLSYAAFQGHISLFVLWPARDDVSSWQIRTRYHRRWLKRLIWPAPPENAIEEMESIRGRIHRFLLAQEAEMIQWMSAEDAERRLH